MPPRRARGTARDGRTSLAVPLLVLWVVALASVHGMQARADQEGFGWVDPAAIDVARLASWADPRWADELSSVLAGLAPFRVDDEQSLAGLAGAIETLAFVDTVGAPEVVWPRSLRLPVTLREPVACIPVGQRFRTVAADGTLLPGLWPMPPRLGVRWLPVLGPMRDATGIFRAGRPGDYLAEAEHVAALDVALSMRAALGDEEQGRLGPVVIDASRVGEASVEEPGIRLLLEGSRTIFFGRAPSGEDPGELPAERKWDAVRRGIGLLASGRPEDDWELLDVRWDHAEIGLREPLLVAALPDERAPARGRHRPGRARSASRVAAGAVREAPGLEAPGLEAHPRHRVR